MDEVYIKDENGIQFKVTGEWDGQKFNVESLEREGHDVSYILELDYDIADDVCTRACEASAEKEACAAEFAAALKQENPGL